MYTYNLCMISRSFYCPGHGDIYTRILQSVRCDDSQLDDVY